MPFESQEVMIVRLSDEERISGAMTPESLAKAIAGMHRDGLVVLENAADVAHVDQLNGILAPEAEILAKLPTTHFNNNSINGKPTGNMSQAPPMTPDLMYDDIWANPAAVEVISALLGPKPRVNYVNGNTALGGFNGARQRVHADFSSPHATYPFAIVANIYLSDVSPANGSTELWLGSHRNTTFADHRNYLHPELDFGIREDLLVERQKYAPPIQPVVKRGSVVLRDLRLWHAGLANPTRDPRMMLAFVHTPAWYLCPGKVVLPEDAREKPIPMQGLSNSLSTMRY
ncbi:hypothetical protein BDV06DRAFT_216135 [Aspergillus oleicola]